MTSNADPAGPFAQAVETARPAAASAADGVARSIASLPGDRTIAYAQAGAGPDCLLVHGTLMTLEDSWLGPMPALSENFRVTAVDRPGHGLSRRRRLVDASPWRQAAILHDFAREIGLAKPVLVGHSYGGTVAMAYAILFPRDVGGLVALAPMCLPELRLEAMLFGPRSAPFVGDGLAPLLGVTADLALLQTLWRTMFLPQRMPEPFSANFPFDLAARFEQMVAEGEDAVALQPALVPMAMSLAGCRVPTRILGGTADLVVNNAAQGQVAAMMMPDAGFTWLPGLGHMLHHLVGGAIRDAALDCLGRGAEADT